MIRDEALDSWGGDDQMHGSEMWGVWGTNLKEGYGIANMIFDVLLLLFL